MTYTTDYDTSGNAAEAMRRILVENARKRARLKRGGRLELDDRALAAILGDGLDELQPRNGETPGRDLAPNRPRSKRAGRATLIAATLLVVALGASESAGLTRFRGAIVRVINGEGTLVVELDDPAASVSVDDTDIVVKGAGVHELRVTAGTHLVSTRRDGSPIAASNQVVTVERDGRNVVTVTRIPKRPDPPPRIAAQTAEQARSFQQSWANQNNLPVEYVNSLGMKFRLIPPGEFEMGAASAELAEAPAAPPNDPFHEAFLRSESPRHVVRITNPFYLGATEVTRKEYETLMGPGASPLAEETANLPIASVSWFDAIGFARELTLREYAARGVAAETVARDAPGYRLPTEAEWERACRAGSATRFWFGDSEAGLERRGWYVKNSRNRSRPVGTLEPNPFGLFDVCGNVAEWCLDIWKAGYYSELADRVVEDPLGPVDAANSLRVVRGGGRIHRAFGCASHRRLAGGPGKRFDYVGFRLALSVEFAKGVGVEP